MKKFIVPLLTIGVVVAIVLGGCVPAPAPEVTPPPVTPPPVTPPPAVEYPAEITVGFVRPMTGPYASYGEKINCGMEIAVKQINELGGIENLGGAKIKAVFGDDTGSPDQAAAEAERLISVENIACIIGVWPTSMAVGDVAERYEVPYVNPLTIAPITARGYRYTFNVHPTALGESAQTLDGMLSAAEEAGLPPPKTVWMQYIADDCALADAEEFKPQAMAAGLEIVGEEIVDWAAPTFVPQLMKIEAAKPDILYNMHGTGDGIIMYREMMERETYFPYGVFSWGGATSDPFFYESLPLRAYNYGFMIEDGDGMPQIRPYYDYINSQFETMIGVPWEDTHQVPAYYALWIIKDALERVEYDLDLATFRNNLRDAIAATNITMGTCEMVTLPDGTTYCPTLQVGNFPQIAFDAAGQNLYSNQCVSQNINGVRWPLYPEGCREPDAPSVVLPIPPWSER